MRVLIITSESLNPGDTLSSTFELTQARILSRQFEVAVLSVKANSSVIGNGKSLVKKLIGKKEAKNLPVATIIRELWESFLFLAGKRKLVREHVIEGITVYEGVGYYFSSPMTLDQGLKRWLQAGLNAFSRTWDGPFLVHAHGRFLYAGVLAMEIKKRYGLSYIYTEHSTYYQRGLAPVSLRGLVDEVIRNASCFTVVSESLLHHIQLFLGKEIKDTRIIPNALDEIFEATIPAYENERNEFVFINIASLDFKKGQDILIRSFGKAWSGNEYFKLYICGDGPLKKELQALVKELGLEKVVIFTGRLSKAEVVHLLDRSDIFVLPSRTETFGVAVIEALSRGKPVIATRSGGPEYLITSLCGQLIEPESEEQLTAALIKGYEDHSQFDARAIRTHALEEYGTDAFLRNMIQLFKLVS